VTSSQYFKNIEESELIQYEREDKNQPAQQEELIQPKIGLKAIRSLGKRTVVPSPDQLTRVTKRKIQLQIN